MLISSRPSVIPLSISLSCWFWARTPTSAPLISASQSQPFLGTQLQLPVQVIAWVFPVDEIAESSSHASFATIQSTAGFPEIGDWAEFTVDGAGGVPAGVEGVAGFLSTVFVLETRVDVADEIFCK